ncbi:hypothetical protein ACSBR2_015229 [Camellia fascicularis]
MLSVFSFARGRVERPVRHRSSVQRSSDQRSLSISPVRSWVEISAFTSGRYTCYSARSAQYGIYGGDDVPAPGEYENYARGRCSSSGIYQTAGCDHDPTGRANYPATVASWSISFTPSSSPAKSPNTRGDGECPECPGGYRHPNRATSAPNSTSTIQGTYTYQSAGFSLRVRAVTLPDRFKMPHIDGFDRSGDPMVHLSLFSDVLHLMGLTRLQKLSLFGRTLSGITAI